MNLLKRVQQQFRAALAGLVPDPEPYVAMVRPSQDARFGDYQANCAMPLAKVLGKKPREVADEIVSRLPLEDLLEPPAVAGPGFINVRLRDDWLAAEVQKMEAEGRLGVEPASPPRTVVIDYSSPNVAKPLHVGHLRSTIIGDALARLFRFLGHRVITDNHLGDWGTQFGILLYGYKHFLNKEAFHADPVQELARLYVHVRGLMKKKAEAGGEDADDLAEDPSDPVAEAARQETAKLHAGDPENVSLWREFMPACMAEVERIYRRLNVRFDWALGESFYHAQLSGLVQELESRGLAQPSRGAVVIFFTREDPPRVLRAGEELPGEKSVALVRKKDGAFTYTATDLATIRYRMETWQPDAILYAVDFRQALHFKQLFATARAWGYEGVELQHISFGSVLGEDGKPLGARKGGAVELGALLDEAVAEGARRYEEACQERLARHEEVPDLSADERGQVAEVVGGGAVKYADLAQNRTSDYVFSWDKMLATEGNTATYMQYAYARIRSILRRGQVDVDALRVTPPLPGWEKPEERVLALQLLRLEEALQAAAEEYKPSVVTAYLWDLAKSYSQFYNRCPVLKAPSPELRQSRLLLCDLTARVIQRGLELLGISTLERM